jgi:HPt (histidine-containing phosphotransfer) domain-containing protein
MDVQMPVMDGYSATQAIRNLKPEIRSVPIIAMTAHAMAGDADKSLQAGMNDHVTKPIDPDRLFATLQKWIKPHGNRARIQPVLVEVKPSESAGDPPREDALPESLPGFDLRAGLKRLGGNRRLYRKLLLDFAADYIGAAADIREAVAAGDFERAHRLVHNLKGLAGNLAATELQAAAVNLEKLLRGTQQPPPAAGQLNSQLSALENGLNQVLGAVQGLGAPAQESVRELSGPAIAAIPIQLARDIAGRIRRAAEMGDNTALMAIAEDIGTRSGVCIPLGKKINQMIEDFDLEGIQHLAGELDAC